MMEEMKWQGHLRKKITKNKQDLFWVAKYSRYKGKNAVCS